MTFIVKPQSLLIWLSTSTRLLLLLDFNLRATSESNPTKNVQTTFVYSIQAYNIQCVTKFLNNEKMIAFDSTKRKNQYAFD